MAVVDAAGGVRRLEGLGVCDASVIQTITCANLNVPVNMIAEKMADGLKARLGEDDCTRARRRTRRAMRASSRSRRPLPADPPT